MSDDPKSNTRPVRLTLELPGPCGHPVTVQAAGEYTKDPDAGWILGPDELEGLMAAFTHGAMVGYASMLEHAHELAEREGRSVSECPSESADHHATRH